MNAHKKDRNDAGCFERKIVRRLFKPVSRLHGYHESQVSPYVIRCQGVHKGTMTQSYSTKLRDAMIHVTATLL